MAFERTPGTPSTGKDTSVLFLMSSEIICVYRRIQILLLGGLGALAVQFLIFNRSAG
jgi:hypothetical protein